jgi:hypothetical protein
MTGTTKMRALTGRSGDNCAPVIAPINLKREDQQKEVQGRPLLDARHSFSSPTTQ